MIMILKVIMMFTQLYDTKYCVIANVELSFADGDDDIESHNDMYTKIVYKWCKIEMFKRW